MTLSDRSYVSKLVFYAFLVRILLLLGLWSTDAISRFRLSPDAERYHYFGLIIMREMKFGNFNWSGWIDDAWFQFTGLVYYLLGPNPLPIQLVNILLSSTTVLIVFHLALVVSKHSHVARISALVTAFFPSFIIWSCLALKDTLAIFAMSLLVLSTLKIRSQFHVGWLLGMFVSLLIFLGIRDYMFFVCVLIIAISMIFFTPHKLPRTGSWLALAALCFVPWMLGYGAFGYSFIQTSFYFDLDYINHVRVAMGDHGSGALFEHSDVATWGEGSLGSDILAFLKGVLFFFVSLNPADVGSVRQLMALPEVLLVMLLLPFLARGLYWIWLDRNNSFPVLVFSLVVMLMLVSATTNIGAMFRWRMQVMPLFVIAMAIGVFWLRRGFFYRVACKLTGAQP